MSYQTYKDTETGNDVQAVECGHGGTLVAEHIDFHEGDFIVKFPLGLLGPTPRMVFDKTTFNKRFKGEPKRYDWATMSFRS